MRVRISPQSKTRGTVLACLEVFAFGSKRTVGQEVGYYAARALIGKYTAEVVALVLQRGAVDVSAPVVTSMVSEIVSRFGLVVSDKVAAGALPILGAVGGATVNVIFMDHFQRIAQGHFTLRGPKRMPLCAQAHDLRTLCRADRAGDPNSELR